MATAVGIHRTGWRRREVVTPSGVRARALPVGASLSSLLALLAAAWGGVSVFWGPDFGYRPTSASAWDWTTQNWLLHLIPGAVGVAAGFMLVGAARRRRVGGTAMVSLPALLLVAAGAWFVLGPVIWPTFESGPAFALGVSSARDLLNQAGSSLGPGLLLVFFGGMALKAGIARPAIAVDDRVIGDGERVVPATEPVVARDGEAMATRRAEPVGPVAAGAPGAAVADRTVADAPVVEEDSARTR